MRVAKAKRRWLRWCRYVQHTQSRTDYRRGLAGVHAGQVKAWADYSKAHRWVPTGIRAVWQPRWGQAHPNRWKETP